MAIQKLNEILWQLGWQVLEQREGHVIVAGFHREIQGALPTSTAKDKKTSTPTRADRWQIGGTRVQVIRIDGPYEQRGGLGVETHLKYKVSLHSPLADLRQS